MDDQNKPSFTETNPVDFTDALKWYAIAKEKQNNYENTYQKLKEQMEMNGALQKEVNQLKAEIADMRQKLMTIQADADAEIHKLRNSRGTNAEYLVSLLQDAGRNVHELRVVFREPDPWDEDEERIF